jgi:hypothetical protein
VSSGLLDVLAERVTTSVGTAAIDRFLRPVTYQGAPEAVLPPALREDNPWHLPRRVDGGAAGGVTRAHS